MFDLNEAPDMVLAKISSVTTSRNCGTFWSILCFIPSCGSTVGCCTDDRGNQIGRCCYPDPVPLRSKAGLRALIDALNKLRISSQEVMNTTDLHSMIEWQVTQTNNLLKQVVEDNIIKDDYLDALNEVYIELHGRAAEEEKFSCLIEKYKRPLNEDLYLPKYGMMKSQS